MSSFGWPPNNVFYVRGALTWVAIVVLAVAVVMGLISLNLLVNGISDREARHATRFLVASIIGVASLMAIWRLTR